MQKVIMLLSLFTAIAACSLPKLGLSKQDVKPNSFKIQGFYYSKTDYTNFVFFENGVVLGGFTESMKDRNIYAISKSWTDKERLKFYQAIPYAWGLFQVNGQRLKINKWSSLELGAYLVSKKVGSIVNDSTLLIVQPKIGIDTFCFHYLAVKPDSTNSFIK
ncbi:MAG: hypothetical protein U5L45_15040 [Saprospiraceae bacterium]|nr:hypothetical protein [Saprospiraceae bacterium]